MNTFLHSRLIYSLALFSTAFHHYRRCNRLAQIYFTFGDHSSQFRGYPLPYSKRFLSYICAMPSSESSSNDIRNTSKSRQPTLLIRSLKIYVELIELYQNIPEDEVTARNVTSFAVEQNYKDSPENEDL